MRPVVKMMLERSRMGALHIVEVTFTAVRACRTVHEPATQFWMAALMGPSLQMHCTSVGAHVF